MVRAVVMTAPDRPLEVAEIDLPEPGPGQVRVRIAAAGVCHSDLSIAQGKLLQKLPVVLGHEATGTVSSVGDGVTDVKPGSAVILNWAPTCGTCRFCRRGESHLCPHIEDPRGVPYAALPDGTDVYQCLGVGAFAEDTLVAATGVLPLPDGVPIREAALLSCAVLTGYGAVRRSAKVREGESVAVFGLGGVGLSAVQAARIAGAGRVVAVDLNPTKEAMARACGATDFLPFDPKVASAIRKLTDGDGADVTVECVGRSESIRTAWSSARRGGRVVVVGIGRKDDMVSFSALELFHYARSLTGCIFGDSDPVRDLPELMDHVRSGAFSLDGLISERVGLDGVPDAFERMAAGAGARTLVVL